MNGTERRDRMRAIAERLRSLSTHDTLTRAQADEFDALTVEWGTLDRAERADRDQRAAALLGGHTEPGTDPGTPIDARTVRRSRIRGTDPARGAALDLLDRLERDLEAEGLARRSGPGGGGFDTMASLIESPDTGTEAARWLNVAGSPDYAEAFRKVTEAQIRGGKAGAMDGYALFTDGERAAWRRAAEYRTGSHTTADGGALVPAILDAQIHLTNTGSVGRLRDAFRVENIVTDAYRGVTSAGVSASFGAENSAVADGSPDDMAVATVTARRGTAFVPASYELVQDMAGGFVAVMSRLLMDGRTRAENAAFITGASGSNQPNGIVTAAVAASKTKASATSETFALDDVYALYGDVPARWRNNPGTGWIASDLIWNAVRRFGEGTTGSNSATLVDSLAAGGAPTLLGKPAHTATDMDGVIDTGEENYLMVFGDLREYVVADRVGSASLSMVDNLFDTSTGMPTGTRGLLLFWRTGGDLVVPDAVRVLNAT